MIDSKSQHRLSLQDYTKVQQSGFLPVSASLLPLSLLFVLLFVGCGKKPRQMPIPSDTDGSPTATTVDRGTLDSTAPQPELDLRVEPERISPGESALLTWESRHARQVFIEPAIGEVDLSGRIKFFPEQTATYRITANGPGGTLSETVTVVVGTGSSRLAPDIQQVDLRNSTVEERFQSSVKPVYFGFDSAELTEEALLTLDVNIRWLSRLENQNIRFLLEGHADARGSDEYNLALADKRAQIVFEYLVSNGISQSRMTALSLGEERPFDSRETEEAYALNRRTHFVMIPSP